MIGRGKAGDPHPAWAPVSRCRRADAVRARADDRGRRPDGVGPRSDGCRHRRARLPARPDRLRPRPGRGRRGPGGERHGHRRRCRTTRAAGATGRRARSTATGRHRRERRPRGSATKPLRGAIGWPTSATARRVRATSSPRLRTPSSSGSSSEVRRDNGDSPIGIEILLRAAGDRKRAAAARAQAAIQREAAARDRERAAEDRRLAARDRAAAAGELALEGADYLTGALRRRVGLAAIQRELDRTSRTGERLVVAFVDVDGLKAINDKRGHAAGDDRLRAVAQAIMQHLRSYDVIVRFGGDEFVCSLSGQDAGGARDALRADRDPARGGCGRRDVHRRHRRARAAGHAGGDDQARGRGDDRRAAARGSRRVRPARLSGRV